MWKIFIIADKSAPDNINMFLITKSVYYKYFKHTISFIGIFLGKVCVLAKSMETYNNLTLNSSVWLLTHIDFYRVYLKKMPKNKHFLFAILNKKKIEKEISKILKHSKRYH